MIRNIKIGIPNSAQGFKFINVTDNFSPNEAGKKSTLIPYDDEANRESAVALINYVAATTPIVIEPNQGLGILKAGSKNQSLDIFKQEIDKLPSVDKIQSYLQRLSNLSVNKDLLEYHYLLLQSGSFGSKQIWVENDKWKNNSFRSYWTPTETSNRRSPVNPMMPMPNTLFDRVKNIVDYMAGSINAINLDISKIEWHFDKNSIVYIDPPYKNTTGYGFNFDYEEFIINNWAYVNIYVSEGYKMDNVEDAILLSKGRAKGSISGDIKKKPTEEWLNIFKLHDLK